MKGHLANTYDQNKQGPPHRFLICVLSSLNNAIPLLWRPQGFLRAIRARHRIALSMVLTPTLVEREVQPVEPGAVP